VLLIGATPNAESVDAGTTGKRLPFVEGDTVLSLLERAGGINAPGDLKRAFISRPKPKGAAEVIPLDLEALLVRRDLSADHKVATGDTIVVPPMQFAVLVEGAVARAGLYNYNPSYGIAQYIARAGGRTRTARDLDDAVLIDANGTTHPFNASTRPTPGDAIIVPERNYSRSEVAQLVLAGASVVLGGIAVALAATR
jgi:protein involved in polysaccharide export with SLBB domain